MELSGFLAPDGTFTECKSWCHTSEAEKICKDKYGKDFTFSLHTEDFLYEQGYVGFYARNVNHRFLVNGNVVLLTDEQIDFIINNLSRAFNDDQKKAMEDLLSYNEAYSDRSILHHYENRIVT